MSKPNIGSMHLPSRRVGGFTLAETMLVIIIGAIVLGAGAVMFRQLRESAGFAVAQARVQAARTLVERVVTQQAIPPSRDAFYELLLANRREDHANSPWGGPSDCGPDRGAQNPPNSECWPSLAANGFTMRHVHFRAGTPRFVSATTNHGDSGLLYYFRVARELTNPGSPEIMIFDNATKAYKHFDTYALAYCDNQGRRFLFPSGPPVFLADGSVAADTTSAVAVGGGSSSGSGSGGSTSTSGGGFSGRVGGSSGGSGNNRL
ncbi:MAG: prepilin-type N-terminal cleavage/methylation domain-containing protein [Candidatus Sericytochromatia bacterium]|nr:prepilin-type N-terminal cleavage/methylation domain-containing protein [Candidatus Tanganyikabacteria bacterium]